MTEAARLRIVLAAVGAFDAVSLGVLVRQAAARAAGEPRAILRLLASTPSVVLLAAIAVASLVLFARRRRPIASGVAALAAIGTLEHVLAAVAVSGHQHGFFVNGAALGGWLVGLAFAARMDADPRTPPDPSSTRAEGIAAAGARAALAATYVDAALSKLTKAGLTWTEATSLRAAIVSSHDVDDTSPLAAYARLVVDVDGVARALSVATLVIQLGAFALVLGPRVRTLWGALLLSFHLNVAALTGIFYVESCVLLVAFALPWPAGRRGAAPGAEAAPVVPDAVRSATRRVAAWLAGALVVAWLIRASRCYLD